MGAIQQLLVFALCTISAIQGAYLPDPGDFDRYSPPESRIWGDRGKPEAGLSLQDELEKFEPEVQHDQTHKTFTYQVELKNHNFEVHSLMEYAYYAPSVGKVNLHLRDSNNIYLSVVLDHYYETITLRSFTDGSWNAATRVQGYPKTKRGDIVNLVIIAEELGFVVVYESSNLEKTQTTYGYQTTVPSEITAASTYSGYLRTGLVLYNYTPGRIIYTRGYTDTDFHVTLFNGIDIHSDIAIQMYVDTYRQQMHRYSRIGGKNTDEEIGEFPFTVGEDFTLHLLCQTYQYEIGTNGTHLATYGHRIPYQPSMMLLIGGVSEIEDIQCI